MGVINTKVSFRDGSHENWMAGPSYFVGPLLTLRMAAASCFFGEPMYYHRDGKDKRKVKAADIYTDRLSSAAVKHLQKMLDARGPQEWRSWTPAQIMENAIDAALANDPEATLHIAAGLRNEDLIRTTPQVIMVRAANTKAIKGTGMVRLHAPSIIKRTDEVSTQLAYQLIKYGKPVPNSLKRAWADYLGGRSEYELAKYRLEGHMVNLYDVVNVCHAKSGAINKLMKGQLSLGGEIETWESIRSGGGSWPEAMRVMGHMALLRNLRNLLESGVVNRTELAQRLLDGVENGKQLPFRYYSAYRAIEHLQNFEDDQIQEPVMDALSKAIDFSVVNLPQLPGRTMSLCDNSGSARGTTTSSMGSMQVATIANLQAILTGKISEDGWVGVFGDRLDTFPVPHTSSTMDLMDKAEEIGRGIGGGTENGVWIFLHQAIAKKEMWDNIFIFSDMQAGHGGLYGTSDVDKNYFWPSLAGNLPHLYGRPYIDVPKLINEYRSKVNPNVMVYLVQVAGYTDTIVPEWYDKTYILGGWSDSLLRFVAHTRKIAK